MTDAEEDTEVLTKVEEHTYIVEKGDLVDLTRDFDYSETFQLNPGVAELEGILKKDGTVDIGNIIIENVLIDDLSDEINKILGPPLTPDLITDTIIIVEHKYHARLLQYLILDAWDYEWRSYSDLKADKLL